MSRKATVAHEAGERFLCKSDVCQSETYFAFGGVEVDRAAPIPDELRGRHFYFAGAEGISRLLLDSAEVATRLEFDPRGTRLGKRRSWGQVYGSPELSTLDGGGFVLHANRALSFRVSRADFSPDDLLMGSSTVAQTADGGYWARGTAFWEIEAQYNFSVESHQDTWLVVQWAPDREMIEAGCQHRYELFHLEADGPANRVASNSYGCDV